MDGSLKLVHIVLDIFRIGGNDRAVVVVDCIRELVALVRDTRVEDELHTVTDQPGHMSVGKLGRIAFGFTWDGLNTQLVDLTVEVGESTTWYFSSVKKVYQNG